MKELNIDTHNIINRNFIEYVYRKKNYYLYQIIIQNDIQNQIMQEMINVCDQIIELFETKISDLIDLINILDDIKRDISIKSDFKITNLKSDFHLIDNLINIFLNEKVTYANYYQLFRLLYFNYCQY